MPCCCCLCLRSLACFRCFCCCCGPRSYDRKTGIGLREPVGKNHASKFFQRYESLMDDVSPDIDYNYFNKPDVDTNSTSVEMTGGPRSTMDKFRHSVNSMFQKKNGANPNNTDDMDNDDTTPEY